MMVQMSIKIVILSYSYVYLEVQWIASDRGKGEKREPYLLLVGMNADWRFLKILNTELPYVCSVPIHTAHINPVDSAGRFLPPQNSPLSESDLLSWTLHLLLNVAAAETVPNSVMLVFFFSQ